MEWINILFTAKYDYILWDHLLNFFLQCLLRGLTEIHTNHISGLANDFAEIRLCIHVLIIILIHNFLHIEISDKKISMETSLETDLKTMTVFLCRVFSYFF